MQVNNYYDADDLPGLYANGEGVVYIISDIGQCKIGSTRNPMSRIRSIMTTSGRTPVSILLSEPCANYRDIEKELHGIFGHCRRIGEWFICEPWQAGVLLEEMEAVRAPAKAEPGIEIAASINL